MATAARLPRRRALISCAALAALAAFAGQVPAKPSRTSGDSRPNIVVIMTDDQSVREMVALPRVRNMIGAEGAEFVNSFSVFPLCCPSRATFLTGLYAHNHGVLHNRPPLGGYTKLDHTRTLPVWLQGTGYATIHIGKYLNGYETHGSEVPPGWSEWYGGVSLSYYGGAVSANGTFRAFPPTAYQTDSYASVAKAVIERHAANPRRRPFFLWIAPYAVHIGGPIELDDLAGQKTPARAVRHRGAFATAALPRPPSFNVPVRSNIVPFTPEKIGLLEHHYRQRLEALLAVDELVGVVIGALRAAGELDNTLLVFTSDNGWLHGEHVLTGKEWFYDPSIRVPLLMRGPGIPRGLRLRQHVANIDLAPTILNFAQIKAPIEHDGRSLRPLFVDPSLAWHRDFVIENRGMHLALPYWRAVRTPRYLYAVYPNAQLFELYDVVADPHQVRNLAADPRYAGVKAALAERLAVLTTCRGATCRTFPPPELR